MFFTIFYQITLPVFLLIGVGVLVNWAYQPDIPTLTRLSFNVFLPALVFIKTLDAQLSADVLGGIFAITTAHAIVVFLVGWVVFSHPFLRPWRAVGTLAGGTPNTGNYGIPLAALAYGAFGANVMAIIVLIHIFFTLTVGIWLMDRSAKGMGGRILGLFKAPLFWAGVVSLVLSFLNLDIPAPLRTSLSTLSNALVGVALVTLGIQLGRSRIMGEWKALGTVNVIRLLASPLLAAAIVLLWDWLGGAPLGDAGPIIVVGAGMPVAVNTFILASEYDNGSELASRSIFWTTIVSALTLTVILALYRI